MLICANKVRNGTASADQGFSTASQDSHHIMAYHDYAHPPPPILPPPIPPPLSYLPLSHLPLSHLPYPTSPYPTSSYPTFFAIKYEVELHSPFLIFHLSNLDFELNLLKTYEHRRGRREGKGSGKGEGKGENCNRMNYSTRQLMVVC